MSSRRRSRTYNNPALPLLLKRALMKANQDNKRVGEREREQNKTTTTGEGAKGNRKTPKPTVKRKSGSQTKTRIKTTQETKRMGSAVAISERIWTRKKGEDQASVVFFFVFFLVSCAVP